MAKVYLVATKAHDVSVEVLVVNNEGEVRAVINDRDEHKRILEIVELADIGELDNFSSLVKVQIAKRYRNYPSQYDPADKALGGILTTVACLEGTDWSGYGTDIRNFHIELFDTVCKMFEKHCPAVDCRGPF